MKALSAASGRRPDASGSAERAIEIDLARRQHALEARALAEAKLRRAGEPDGARPPGRTDIRAARTAPACGAALTFALARHGTATVPRPSRARHRGGARQRERAVEARRVVLQPQRAVGLDRKRMIGRIEAELAASCCRRRRRGSPRGDSRSARRPTMKPPSPFTGPSSERRSPLNQNPSSARLRAARAVAQVDAAILDRNLLDLQPLGIEAEARGRPVERARSPQGRAKPRARPRAARTRDTRRASANRAPARHGARARARAAARRCRSRPGQASASGSAGGATSIGPAMRTGWPASCVASASKRRAILGPVDEMRPDQRRYQRQDDRDAQSEQGRLQSVLRAPSVLSSLDRLALNAPIDADSSRIQRGEYMSISR